MSDSAKTRLAAQISQKAIDEALKAVEGHGENPAAAAETPDAGVEVEVSPPGADDALKQELEKARAALKEKDTILEMSQQRSREMMERLKDTHDRMLRALADLDNYKKRAAKEKEEVIRFGNEKLLKEFLPVLDNLDRALTHAQQTPDFESLLKGVGLTRKSFEDALAKRSVKAFSALGQPFDPNVHEAVQQVESADAAPNTVVQELMRGYFLNDRLMRPAVVVVSRAPAAATAPAQDSAPPPSGEPSPGEPSGSGEQGGT